MNKKLTEIIEKSEISLSESDSKNITSSLGITNLRRNPTEEQEIALTQICNLIKEGKDIEQAIAEIVKNDELDSSLALDVDAELEAIITQQATMAADATLSTLPNIAQAESASLRQKFIQQFRNRIQQQLQSPEYQEAFVAQIKCLGELPTFNSSTTNIALPSSSSSSS